MPNHLEDAGLAREAKALVALLLRNGPIETMHAGKPCPTCSSTLEYSHITDDETKMIHTRVFTWSCRVIVLDGMFHFVQRLKNEATKRKLRKAHDRVYAAFEDDLAKATGEDQQQIESRRYFECSEFTDEIQRMDSLDLLARAARCHIDVIDIGEPMAGVAYHWTTGEHGTRFLRDESFRKLSKAVEEAEYLRAKRTLELRDFWWKLVTAIAAIVAAVVGVLNYLAAKKP